MDKIKLELGKSRIMLWKNMNKRMFHKLRKHSRSLVIICVLPHLKYSCDFLTKSQLNNGSWSNDILATSLAIQALASFLNVVGKDSQLRNKINLGAEFLRGSLKSLSDEILEIENLYRGLDKIAIEFGNAIYTLWLVKSLEDNNFFQKVCSAFLKVEENVKRFIKALNNLEVTCSVLNCHVIPSFPPPPEPILEFAITQLFSDDISPKDAFSLIILLENLKGKFSSLINEKWNYHVSRRTDKWKDVSLKEGLRRLAIEKSEEVLSDEKTEITTLSYCLISINRLNIEAFDNQKRDIQKRIIEKLLNLFSRISVWEGELSIPDLSLFICAISESPISNVAYFPNKESDYVINAVKWFEAKRSEKIKMLKSSQYTLLISIVFILIGIIALLSYVAITNPLVTILVSTILPLVISAIFYLIGQPSPKS